MLRRPIMRTTCSRPRLAPMGAWRMLSIPGKILTISQIPGTPESVMRSSRRQPLCRHVGLRFLSLPGNLPARRGPGRGLLAGCIRAHRSPTLGSRAQRPNVRAGEQGRRPRLPLTPAGSATVVGLTRDRIRAQEAKPRAQGEQKQGAHSLHLRAHRLRRQARGVSRDRLPPELPGQLLQQPTEMQPGTATGTWNGIHRRAVRQWTGKALVHAELEMAP